MVARNRSRNCDSTVCVCSAAGIAWVPKRQRIPSSRKRMAFLFAERGSWIGFIKLEISVYVQYERVLFQSGAGDLIRAHPTKFKPDLGRERERPADLVTFHVGA